MTKAIISLALIVKLVFVGSIYSISLRRDQDFVHVAPYPILTCFERSDERMLAGVEVPGGVPVLGIVTATYVTADQAQAQMDPRIPDLQAVLAAPGAGRDVPDLSPVGAFLRSAIDFGFAFF
jgi:hypothetical protein